MDPYQYRKNLNLLPDYEYHDVKQGDTGNAVVLVQYILQQLGFYKGPLNGVFNEDTIEALNKLQQQHHVPVTETIDSSVWTFILGVATNRNVIGAFPDPQWVNRFTLSEVSPSSNQETSSGSLPIGSTMNGKGSSQTMGMEMPMGTQALSMPMGTPSFGTQMSTQMQGMPMESPSYGTPSYGTPSYGTPSYGTPSYGTPSYGTPSYGTPSYGTPSYGTPSYGTPSYGTPSYGTPSYGTPSYGTPSYGTPSYGTPSEEPGYGVPVTDGGQLSSMSPWSWMQQMMPMPRTDRVIIHPNIPSEEQAYSTDRSDFDMIEMSQPPQILIYDWIKE